MNNAPMTILTTPLVVDGAPSEAVTPSASTMSPAPSRPRTQPNRNDRLLAVDRLENSIRITAMIGTGLIATPTAGASIAPIASPMVHRLLEVVCFVAAFDGGTVHMSWRVM